MSLGEGETAAPDVSTTDPLYVLASTTVQTHSYVTQSGKIIRETVTSADTATQLLDFLYDENGRPFALKYTNGTADPVTYYYVLNLQGDVVGLIDSSGTYVAQYTYTAWGEILTATGTMAEINPLRYRGYYYDTETGFYYLQSRYYDPVTHRFINADSLASTGQGVIGTNMFSYCLNNPVCYEDCSGNSAQFINSFYTMCIFEASMSNGELFTPVLYNTMDEAAEAAGKEANLLTQETDMEYACGIYQMGGMYYYGKFYEGMHRSGFPDEIIAESESLGATIVAYLHSHPYCTCTQKTVNVFSVYYGYDEENNNEWGIIGGDAYIVKEYGVPLYLASPSGQLLKLTLHYDRYPCTTYINRSLPVDNTLCECPYL